MNLKPAEDKPRLNPRMKYSGVIVLAAIVALVLAGQFIVQPLLAKSIEISYSDFVGALRAGRIASVTVSDTQITGTRKDGTQFYAVRVEDPNLLQQLETQNVAVQGQVTDAGGGLLGALLSWVLPIALIAGLWYWMTQRMKGGAGRD